MLLMLSDQHRADWLGRNPAIPAPTPNIDRLAARVVDFTEAAAASPVCGASRSRLASGQPDGYRGHVPRLRRFGGSAGNGEPLAASARRCKPATPTPAGSAWRKTAVTN